MDRRYGRQDYLPTQSEIAAACKAIRANREATYEARPKHHGDGEQIERAAREAARGSRLVKSLVARGIVNGEAPTSYSDEAKDAGPEHHIHVEAPLSAGESRLLDVLTEFI